MNFSANIRLPHALLRPHRAEDKASFASTPRDPDFYRMTGTPRPVVSNWEEAEIWYQKKHHCLHSWAIEADSNCIGSVWIHSLEPHNRRGRFAIEIFNASYRGQGIGTAVTRAIIKVAFEELCLHRLDLRVLTINHRAIRCYERCGFKPEGIQRDTLFLDGVWYSDLWMSILEQEYNGNPIQET